MPSLTKRMPCLTNNIPCLTQNMIYQTVFSFASCELYNLVPFFHKHVLYDLATCLTKNMTCLTKNMTCLTKVALFHMITGLRPSGDCDDLDHDCARCCS